MTATINASTTAGVVTTADTSGILQLQTNGTAALTVDASQNVGIGTASPGAKFSLTSTGSTTADGVRLTFGSEARAHNIYSALPTGRDLTIAPFRALTINTGSGTAEGVLGLNAYEYTTFGTGSSYTERMRIDSSGNLLAGGATAAFNAADSSNSSGQGVNISQSVYRPLQAYAENGSVVAFKRNGNNGDVVIFARGSVGQVGSVSVTTTATAYNTSSDYRLKEAIAPMTGALAKVALLKPCTYKWKVDGSDGQGFIAHELDEVVSGCVTGEKDAVDAEGNPQYQGIDTSFLVATLSAAIQELHALVKTQDSTITALTTRITALEAA